MTVLLIVLCMVVTAYGLVERFGARAVPGPASNADAHGPAAGRVLVGMLAMFPMPRVGYAFSALAVPAALAATVRGRERPVLIAKVIIPLCVLYFVGCITAAFFNNTHISGTVLYVLALAIVVFAVSKHSRSISDTAALMVGLSIGDSLFYLLGGSSLDLTAFSSLWKYGIAVPTTFIAIWIALRLGVRQLPIGVLVGTLGVASIFLGFRSHGLICLVGAVIIVTQSSRGGRLRAIAIASLVAMLGAVALPMAIQNGVFGSEVRQRSVQQTGMESSPVANLLGGRTEPPLSLAAIEDKPVLGWGGVEVFEARIYTEAVEHLDNLGLDRTASTMYWRNADGSVSLHSVIAEAWVGGGILAVMLPVTLLMVFVRTLAVPRVGGLYSPLVVVVCLQASWDLLFSTWGYNRANYLGLSVLLVLPYLIGSKSDATLRLRLGLVRWSPTERSQG